ncbi:MAG: hypothetical protein Q9180_007588, partial [Flavoplaca navasiana]
MNVFKLSMTFKALLRALSLSNNIFGVLEPVHMESLILRFAGDMQFGRDKQRIANEAVRIVQRMSRDWLTEGRRPGGICGAALILAARMNNLRRAVKEVVYIVRVAEMTISKRLDEFKATESSGLTVEQFRTIDLPGSADPPSFQKKVKSKEKRKQKGKGKARTRKGSERRPHTEDGVEVDANASERMDSTAPLRRSSRGEKRKAPIEIDDNETTDDESERAGSATPLNGNAQLETPADTQAERDRRSMPPPRVPIDPALLHVTNQRLAELQAGSFSPEAGPSQPTRGRGRPPGKTQSIVKPSASEIQVEEELEAQIEEILHAHEEPNTSGTVPPTSYARSTTSPGAAPTSVAQQSLPPGSESRSENLGPRDEDSAARRNPSKSRERSRSPSQSSQSSTSGDSHSSRSSSRSQSPPPKSRPSPRPTQLITSTSTTQPLLDRIPSSEVIPDDEFADDADVANCLLSSQESTIKERLWVNANSEYLRALQAKVLKQQLAEQNGTARKIVKRKKRRTRMGDLSGVYDERGPPKDAGEAVERMMKKRAFSKKINYQQIQD